MAARMAALAGGATTATGAGPRPLSLKNKQRQRRSMRTAVMATDVPHAQYQSQSPQTPARVVGEAIVSVCVRAASLARHAAHALSQASQSASSRVPGLHGAASLAIPAIACVTSSAIPLITSTVASFVKLYLLLLFVRVLLSWFPNVDWQGQPWLTLRQITDPYLNIFRNIIPPLMGQIDFTPILGFLVLQFVAQVLSGGPTEMDIL